MKEQPTQKLCECGCEQPTQRATRSDSRRGQIKGEPMRFLPGHNSLVKMSEVPARAMTGAEITKEDIAEMRSWGAATAAHRMDSRTREIEGYTKRSFIEMGMILNEMSDRKLFEHLGFSSFDRWLSDAAPVSRSGGYSAMKALREITEVPIEELQQMPRCNVVTLQKLSSGVRRDPEIIEAAKTKSEDDFLSKIEELHPDQHLEGGKKLHIKPSKSARKTIDEAFAAACWSYEVEGREAALEAICAYFMQGRCEREGYSRLSNQVAYETAQLQGKVPA